MTKVQFPIVLFCFFLCACASVANTSTRPLVLTTDFGLADGAVSAMKGVAYSVDSGLYVSDLTHSIPPFNIWEGAYRLEQTFRFWPAGTVFVTVVDPGVGSDRKSVIAKSKSGHYFVGPDNGLLTLIADGVGIEAVRIIDESRHRRKGSEESYTFHGRDVYVYSGAKLASGKISFEQTGPELGRDIVRLSYQKPETAKDGEIKGMIPVLDPNYGNVWTNIPKRAIPAEVKRFRVSVWKNRSKVYEEVLPLADTFSAVPAGKPLLYFNSLMNLSMALNQGDFSKRHKIASGPDWTVRILAVKD